MAVPSSRVGTGTGTRRRLELKCTPRLNRAVFSYVRCQRFPLSRRSQKLGFSATSSYLPSLRFNPPHRSKLTISFHSGSLLHSDCLTAHLVLTMMIISNNNESVFTAVVLSQGRFCPLGDTWQCQEPFWLSELGAGVLSGWVRMLLNTRAAQQSPHPRTPRRAVWPPPSGAPALGNAGLQRGESCAVSSTRIIEFSPHAVP